MEIHNVIIIGGGCAGYAAGIYLGRAEVKPLMIEGEFGGQLVTTSEIENFPGFPDGINGYELMERMKTQAEKCGTKIVQEKVVSVNFDVKPFEITTETTMYKTMAVVIATGATAKRLHVINEDKFWMRGGISACAVCDGALPIFRNKELVVVGGGDSAMEEATFLTKFASKVYIVHRNDKFKASKVMLNRAKKNSKIEFITNTTVVKVNGEKNIQSVVLKNLISGNEHEMNIAGLFYAIGHTPNSNIFTSVKVDENGYILTDGKTTKTNIDGVFACGDVQDHAYRQAITACGSGCMAAIDSGKWLTESEN